ncbi:MAG: photosynthetic protein synthase I [Geobacteraceae bacterium GWC2_53_11]|nr:MAG: photosynthetic protein synthase I [Geobacteraceae bacterium GWC2_53_11]
MTRTSFTLLTLLILILLPLAIDPVLAEEIKYKRTVENYTIPDVTLVNQNGARVKLKDLITSSKPVVLDFIYGTCTTICPVLSAGYTSLQRKLGEKSTNVHLISITIDPEHDTPKVMKEYLKRYQARPGWDFLTGSRSDIDKVMRAFDSYIPNKMYHYPVNLIRDPKDGTWVRILGLTSTSEFMNEYKKAGGII